MANDVLIDMLASLSLESGSVTSSAEPKTVILSDSNKNWPVDRWKHCIVRIVYGKGTGQIARIISNSADSLMASPSWIVGLDTSSVYVIYQPEVSNQVDSILADVNTLFTRFTANRAALLDKLANLAGLPPSVGTVNANWQSGLAPSGEAGATLVTIGAANTKYKVHSLLVDISALTPGATIRVRMFQLVTGIERQVYNQTFTQGVDPDGLWIINGTLAIHEALRVEVHSDGADDGAAVSYDYMLEAM